MAHSSETRWPEAQAAVAISASECIRILATAENTYQELLEVYTFAGTTDTDFAALLFKETIEARTAPDNVPNAEEIAEAADLRIAIQALHDLYEIGIGAVAGAQRDRFAELRRMS